MTTLLFTRAGSLDVRPGPELVAIAAGYLAVRRSGNVIHAFSVGLPVVWILTPAIG